MSDCCETKDQPAAEISNPQATGSGHLIVLGGGSAAFSAALKALDLGGRATIINDGLPMGGTCVNVGCVPSKALIRAAEGLHHAARQQPFDGIETSGKLADFKSLIEQKRSLVSELRQAKYFDVISDLEGVNYIEGRGRLVNSNTVEVSGKEFTGDAILLATGARPHVPGIKGIEDVDYLTNESAFELGELPESLLVLGGRYVALECAQMFARLGSKVTVIQRSDRILPTETPDLTEALTDYLGQEGLDIVTGVKTLRVSQQDQEVKLETEINGQPRRFNASRILIATGRAPNTANLGLEEVGVELSPPGFIRTDETLQTNIPGIYAAGDVLGENMFVYTAAYEGALAAENALNNSARIRDYSVLPWVIFTDPQVAGIGVDEAQATAAGKVVDVAVLPLSHVPRSLAARDTRGFIKLIRERSTDKLIGARILAPEGSELLMEIAVVIKYGVTVGDLVKMFHPYLTLSEGIKLAAIAFDKNINQLSCCAG